jgi:hypothetical protein
MVFGDGLYRHFPRSLAGLENGNIFMVITALILVSGPGFGE